MSTSAQDWMKAQVSFEFMLYLVVAASALSVALFFSAKVYSNESALGSSSAIAQFVSEVNYNMRYPSSNFYAYVPSAFCSAAVSGSAITYGNNTYQFYGNVSISRLCPGGRIENISITSMGDGAYSMVAIQ